MVCRACTNGEVEGGPSPKFWASGKFRPEVDDFTVSSDIKSAVERGHSLRHFSATSNRVGKRAECF